jgi:lysozyme
MWLTTNAIPLVQKKLLSMEPVVAIPRIPEPRGSMSDIEDMLNAQEGTGPMRDGRYFPYQDSEGIWTIGCGHNLEAQGISKDVQRMLLMEDIANAFEAVHHNCSCYDQLSRPRQLVMISLAFNLGRTGLGKFVRFLGALHLGKYDEAADELLSSKAASQAPSRYQQLAHMMRHDVSEWV